MTLKEMRDEVDLLIEKFGPEMEVRGCAFYSPGWYSDVRFKAPVQDQGSPKPFAVFESKED